jgi:spore coat protein CotH
VLTSNGDFVHHNVYLLHDLNTGRWSLVPYDFDVTFELLDRPIDEGTAASPIQPREWVSVLLTRVLHEPLFRAYYCHRLAELTDTLFSDDTMRALIDETFAAIEQDGVRDWHKRHRENNAPFAAGPDELKAYVAERRRFLQGEIAAYCPADRPYLRINEIMVHDQTAWIEVRLISRGCI